MKRNLNTLVGTALLTALVVVLQTFASYFKIGQFTPTLSLIPIIIGAIVYGPLSGGFLGLVFGMIVVIGVLSGQEAMSTMMLNAHPVITVLVCLVKGAMAGVVPGLLYKAIKNETVGTIVAAISAPVANTGLFCLALVLFYMPIAESVAASIGFESAGKFIMVGIVGLNFLVELGINVVLIPVVMRIIKYLKMR